MIEVRKMENDASLELLEQVGYGHLAASLNDEPYIIPIHYFCDGPEIYFYTTEGKKTEIIDSNPKVCLQVEEVVDNSDWQSVIVNGKAERITDAKERERAVEMIRSVNPTLTPALSIKWRDLWIRENREVVYRIQPNSITGRTTNKVKIHAAFARPGAERESQRF